METIENGSITSPKGFRASGTTAGIKQSGKPDMALIVSDVPAEIPTDPLLLVGLTRWHGERCFEDSKTELGSDHWEGRSDLGLKRHQIVSAVRSLILAEVRRELEGEKTGTDRVPSSDCGGRVGGGVRIGGEVGQETGRARSAVDRSSTTGERQSA